MKDIEEEEPSLQRRGSCLVALALAWLEGEDEVSKAKKHGMAAADLNRIRLMVMVMTMRDVEICGEIEL